MTTTTAAVTTLVHPTSEEVVIAAANAARENSTLMVVAEHVVSPSWHAHMGAAEAGSDWFIIDCASVEDFDRDVVATYQRALRDRRLESTLLIVDGFERVRPELREGFLALHARADVHAAVFVSYLEA